MNWEEWLPKIQQYGIEYGVLALKALAIFIVGRIAAGIIRKVADRLMKRGGMDDMLRKFIRNILYAIIMTFVIIAAISALGIQTASLVAVIGAAGLAVGLALQGSLANFAAGVLMIIFRPYKLGDLVNVASTEGFVEEVDVFTTVLRTPDKTKIIIPNGQIMSEQIINYTESELRRMELVVGIGYSDDIEKAREAIIAAIKDDQYVVKDPEPKVSVAELGDSSVNLAVRPWVRSAEYAPASHHLNEVVKKALDAAGVNIPFPQRDVHVFNHNS
ncbi:MAG: mechanosensitive ion channel domain-containing protein [Pseudomonadota bacterium]